MRLSSTAWLRTLVAVALVATLGACGSLPPLRERAVEYAAAVDPATPLATIVAASTPPGEHSGFRLMPLGSYSLDARIQLAQRARHSLVVQYYQLDNDATGRLLMTSLRDASLRGVRVRLLVDDLYTAKSQQPLLAMSRTPNVEVRLYNPFCCGRGGLVSRFASSLQDIARLDHRMHNKLFLADGVMAVIGGRNIADDYFVLGEAQNFIDVDALVVGEVVADLETIFDIFWNSEEVRPIGELVAGEGGRPPSAEEFDRVIGTSVSAPGVAMPSADLLGYGPIAEELDGGRIGFLWGQAQVLADPPSKSRRMTAEESLAASVTMKVWRLIRDAKSEVALSSPYLVPGDRGAEIIDELAKRRVKVTLITNSLAANDEPLVHTGYLRYRRRLLASGADLYELSPARTMANLRFGSFGKSLGRLHAKMIAIDRELVFIGSMNLDPRSGTQNTEMGVVVDCPELALEMLRIITISKLQNSYRLRLDASGKLEWLTDDGEKEMILTSEPEASRFQRFYIPLIPPFVPESLL